MSKPSNMKSHPMNDAGDFPGPATHIAWALGIDTPEAKQATQILSWWLSNPARGKAVFNACESPIERQMIIGWMFSSRFKVMFNDFSIAVYTADEEYQDLASPDFVIEPQVEFDFEQDGNPFSTSIDAGIFARVDFLVRPYSTKHTWKLAVECDGHDFHERTKEQAARDKSRDRRLARCGVVTVLRFTGSEIHENPRACAEEVIATCIALNQRLPERLPCVYVAEPLLLAEESAKAEPSGDDELLVELPRLTSGDVIQ